MTVTANVIGVGYEGLDLDGLVSKLRLRGVVTLVDVRLNPISRRPGLSKTALRTRLEEESIVYEHLPASGNPRDNRQGFSVVTGSEARNARIRFVDRLKAEPGQEALGRASSGSPKPGPLPCCVSREMRPAATGL
nr:DUF488 domain-containing protein [uncultured Microbacterium sp.]